MDIEIYEIFGSVQGGLMRNNIMKLAVNVESISEEKFTIMGSLNDWSDSPNILTDDQINRLEAAGVADHIDPKAKPKIYTHDRSQDHHRYRMPYCRNVLIPG